MWGESTLFHREKSIEIKIEKINIDMRKLFDRIRQKAGLLCQYLSLTANCAMNPDLLILNY